MFELTQHKCAQTCWVFETAIANGSAGFAPGPFTSLAKSILSLGIFFICVSGGEKIHMGNILCEIPPQHLEIEPFQICCVGLCSYAAFTYEMKWSRCGYSVEIQFYQKYRTVTIFLKQGSYFKRLKTNWTN